MPTLSELDLAHARARDAARAARERLATAERAALAAIDRHAEVHRRVVTGAGATSDVTAAAQERDDAIAALRAVEAELRPRGR